MKRRNFLKLSGAAASGLLMTGGLAGCSGSEKGQSLSRIGLQLYTLREAMAADVPSTLAKVAEIGYKEMEFAGYFNHSPQEIAKMMADNGMTAPSAHTPLDIFEGDFDGFLEKAEIMGHKYIVLPWLQEKDRTIDKFKSVANTLNVAGEKAKAAGIQVAYHNHDFEFHAIDGVEPFEILLSETDTDLVQFQLDLYWVAVGKKDPLDYINRYPGRVPSVHVKDMDTNGKMTDVGEGTLDFGRVFRQAEKAGLKHYFIEEDETSDPMGSTKNCFKNLAALEF